MEINELIEKYSLPSTPPEAHYTVYKLTDPEGKVYIGCTGQSVEKRWSKGWRYNSKSHIFKAIRKIGWENFEKSILCEKLTREGAGKLEKWFIAYYDSTNPEKGYNRALGGLGKGVRMCEATRKLDQEKTIRFYKEHPEVIEKIRISVNNLFNNDPLYRERVSKGVRTAFANNPDIRRKLIENVTRKWQDIEYREKVTAAIRKARENPEVARKGSVNMKLYYKEHPEKKEEISKNMKEYLSKPENRKFVDSDSHPKPVICVETGEYFPSQKAAEMTTGYSGIHKVCLGKQNTSGGLHWRYA